MKKIFLTGTFALFCATLFSCSADELSPDNKSATEVKKEVTPASQSYAEDGPGDDPIKVPPPPPQ